MAQTIYQYSPSGSQEEQEGGKLLLARMQRGDLTVEQQIEVVQVIHQYSHDGSEEQQEGGKLLLARAQQGDLTLEQQIQMAEIILENIPPNLFRASEIPYIFKCATEAAMPLGVRDKMYQILRSMVPQFERMTDHLTSI